MLLGKFTHVLSKNYVIRESEKQDRTEDDYEILEVRMYDQTEFGQQGSLFLHYGGSKDFDWDNYDSDSDWGASNYFFGFQNFLEFYTAPSRLTGVRKFVLYTPMDDWTNHETVVIDEIEYADQAEYEATDFEDLMVRLLENKYQVKKVSKESVEKYFDEFQ